MTKEEIITAAIHEAFRCGREYGESYQRMYDTMQQQLNAAKQGKPDHDLNIYDGFFGMMPKPNVKIDPESAINPDSDEVSFDTEAIPGQRIGDTPDEQIAMLTHQLCQQKQENVSLRAQLDEAWNKIGKLEHENKSLNEFLKKKDAIIAEQREELRLYIEKATVHVCSPTGESPHTTTFHEGDPVVISKAFFGENEGPDLRGTILSVLDDSCVVLITEADSIYDHVEFVIENELITKA